jgi:NAD(P)-dependent dehydrogenase (short-subunit alcohol dehydrogenase family)
MNERFNGKVAIVTEAASGIGRAGAEHFFKERASVFAVDRNLECRQIRQPAEGLHAALQGLFSHGDRERRPTVVIAAQDYRCGDYASKPASIRGVELRSLTRVKARLQGVSRESGHSFSMARSYSRSSA